MPDNSKQTPTPTTHNDDSGWSQKNNSGAPEPSFHLPTPPPPPKK